MTPTVGRAQVRAAYVALGLDPDRFDLTATVLIHPDGVTVERLTPGDDGRPIWVEADGTWVTETVELPLVGE